MLVLVHVPDSCIANQGAKSGKDRSTVVVGVVGFPNTGKSSIINSLKRTRVCIVGSTPGVTKCVLVRCLLPLMR